jgi:preprotein translocase subunit YajC
MNFIQFSSVAWAQGNGAAPKGPSTFELLLMPAVFLLVMYFFMIRPQHQKAKAQEDLLTNLKQGDEIYTTAGIIGKVRSVADNFVTVEVAANTLIKVLKSHIGGHTKSLETKAPAKT